MDLGIDLGAANVLVYGNGKGVVLKEPSVVAFDRNTGVIKAIGEEACRMLGKTPGNMIAVRPLREGMAADYQVTERMLIYFVQKAFGRVMFKKPRIGMCIPPGLTEEQKNALANAVFSAGAREVYLVDRPIAAALGTGVDISKECGSMILDIGGYNTNISVILSGKTVMNTTSHIGGSAFDEAIVYYIKKHFQTLIGEVTAEEIKMKIGTVGPVLEEVELETTGRDLISGVPKTIVIKTSEMKEALQEAVGRLAEEVLAVFEKMEPKLAADIRDRGMILAGGGALLEGLEEELYRLTGMHAVTAVNPMASAVTGAGKYIDIMSDRPDF